MQIRLLGTAAGGGVPQWNCNCPICREARLGSGRVQPRTQCSVAITADERHWFLVNASPDIRTQLEQFPALQPPAERARGSAIEAILLTSADLDHTLGLLSVREGEQLVVHATAAIERCLTEGISISPVLRDFCGLRWIEAAPQLSPLRLRDGAESGLLYEMIPLPGGPPRFMRRAGTAPNSANVAGYRISDKKTGGRALVLPGVARIDSKLRSLLAECDVLLFDGTFWSENEMSERGVGTLSASEMGHVPISGAQGSLKVLAELKLRHKIYIHINNTNPILVEDSGERAQVMAAGCAVGMDGMDFVV